MPKTPTFFLLLAMLAGCSYPHGPGSTDLIDGSYHGRPDLTAAKTELCGTTHYGFIELGDRDLHFAYLPDIVFEAPVQPDGTLHDSVGPAVLDGKVADDRLVFSVTTPNCHTDFNMGFIWNHS